MEKEKSNVAVIRTHRVGSITAGFSMVIFGSMLLLHTLFGMISYQMIFSFWPVMLIGLGLELLLSNFMTRKIVYDKGAVFLLIVMTFFVIGIACADFCMETAAFYMQMP